MPGRDGINIENHLFQTHSKEKKKKVERSVYLTQHEKNNSTQ